MISGFAASIRSAEDSDFESFPRFAPRPRYRQRALTPWRPIEAKAVDAPEAE
jgi:hypothetical protein